MQKTIDKRNFIKRMLSLCLLPLIPVSSLLSRKKPENVPLLQSFYRSKRGWPVIRRKWRWYYVGDRSRFKLLDGYRKGENINVY